MACKTPKSLFPTITHYFIISLKLSSTSCLFATFHLVLTDCSLYPTGTLIPQEPIFTASSAYSSAFQVTWMTYSLTSVGPFLRCHLHNENFYTNPFKQAHCPHLHQTLISSILLPGFFLLFVVYHGLIIHDSLIFTYYFYYIVYIFLLY